MQYFQLVETLGITNRAAKLFSDLRSIGKTLPAYPTETEHIYPKEAFTAENAAKIPCNQVLGTYVVKFER